MKVVRNLAQVNKCINKLSFVFHLNLIVAGSCCFPLLLSFATNDSDFNPTDTFGYENSDPSLFGSSKNDDDAIERFIIDETDRLFGPNYEDSCTIDIGIDSKLDDLADSVASVAGRGTRALVYQDSLAKAINLAELGRPTAGSRSDKFKQDDGILGALRQPQPSIVHSRSLNAKAERELIQYLWYTDKKLSSSEKALVLSMFDEDNLPSRQRKIISDAWHEEFLDKLGGGPRLRKLLLHHVPMAGRVAINLADQLYLSPSFLEHLPVIGVGITALKRIGKFPYEIINKIRSLEEHAELMLKLPGDRLETKVKAAVKSKEGRAILSAVGLKSLKWLALKLIDRYKHVSFGKRDVDEIVQRCAYYILMHFAMKLTQCRFGIDE